MELLPLQPGDVLNTYADIKEISSDLNYTPSMSINEGILHFVNWYKKYYSI
jgi:UDP-glucuronate 4-epimerase